MIRPDPRRLLRCALLVALLAPVSRPVRAEPARAVVLLRTPGGGHGRWRAAEDRTRDELRVMGIDVVERELRGDPAAIATALAEHGALLAIHVARTGDLGGVAIWWLDEGELRTTRLDGLAAEGRTAAALTGLRAAELVRAQALATAADENLSDLKDMSITTPSVAASNARIPDATEGASEASNRYGPQDSPLPTGPPQTAAESPTKPTSELPRAPAAPVNPAPAGELHQAPAGVLDPLTVVEPAPTTPPRDAPHERASRERALGIHAGAGGGPGGAGALLGGGLSLRWHLLPNLALQGEALVAASPTWLSGQEHSLRLGLAGARAALVLVARPDARVTWRFALAGGAGLAWAHARSSDRAQVSRDRVAVTLLRAGAQAGIRLRAHWRLVVGVDVELLLPPVVVQVRGVEVARLGTPLVRGVLGFEWDWRPRPRD